MGIKDKIILGSNPIILDIGTYDGKDSIEFLDMYEDARVFAFEADSRSIDLFKHSINSTENMKKLINYYNLNCKSSLNSLYERVNSDSLVLIEKAIANSDGKTTWYQSQQIPPLSIGEKDRGIKEWSASSSINKPKNHLNMTMRGDEQIVEFDESIDVDSIKLDTWFSQQSDIDIIDFVWADVNGGEREMITGGINTFKNNVQYLYTEYSDNELMEGQPNLNDIMEMLEVFELVYQDRNGIKNMYGNVLLKNKNLA